MGSTTHSIVRRVFRLLPLLLWSIVTAAGVQGAPESNALTTIFATESAMARAVEYWLGVFGLTGVIFISVSLLVHAVGEFCDPANADCELVHTSVMEQTYRSVQA